MLKPIDKELGLIPDSILYEVSTAYELSEYFVYPYLNVDGVPVAVNRRSETSRKAVLEDEQGVRLLKEIPWYVEADEKIEAITQFQKRLAQSGVAAPDIYETRDGKLTMEALGKRLFLQEYVQGASWKQSPVQAREMGAELAKLHQASRNIRTGLTRGLEETSVFSVARGVLNLLTRLFMKRRKELNLADQQAVQAVVTKTNQQIKDLEAEAETLGYGAEHLIVHGDYNPHNLIFDESGAVVAVIDFDNICVDDPVHDLAEGLLDVSCVQYRVHSSRFQALRLNPDAELFNAFLKGHQSHEVLSRRMLSLLPVTMAAVALELLVLGLIRGDFPPQEAREFVDHLEDFVQNIRYLTQPYLTEGGTSDPNGTAE